MSSNTSDSHIIHKIFEQWIKPMLISLTVAFLGWTAFTFDSIRISVVEIRSEMKNFIQESASTRELAQNAMDRANDVDRRVIILETKDLKVKR